MIWMFVAPIWAVQDAPAVPESAPQQVAESGCPSLPPGTLLQVAVAENLLSDKLRGGEYFRVSLAEPLVIDGKTVIPAGTLGIGQVVQASHKTFFSTDEGELLVAARYLEVGGKHLPLRGFRINSTTRTVPDRRMMTYASNVDIAAGTVSTAKVAGPCTDAVPLPPPPAKKK